eukprot:4067235-Pleurochrysis_carterae.AAC.1
MSGCARASLVMSAVVCFASRSGADCIRRPETNSPRARAHRIRSAHQLVRLWQFHWNVQMLSRQDPGLLFNGFCPIIASQVRSDLARTSPSTCLGNVAASYHRSGSRMTARSTSSWPLVLDSPVGT